MRANTSRSCCTALLVCFVDGGPADWPKPQSALRSFNIGTARIDSSLREAFSSAGAYNCNRLLLHRELTLSAIPSSRSERLRRQTSQTNPRRARQLGSAINQPADA